MIKITKDDILVATQLNIDPVSVDFQFFLEMACYSERPEADQYNEALETATDELIRVAGFTGVDRYQLYNNWLKEQKV